MNIIITIIIIIIIIVDSYELFWKIWNINGGVAGAANVVKRCGSRSKPEGRSHTEKRNYFSESAAHFRLAPPLLPLLPPFPIFNHFLPSIFLSFFLSFFLL